MVRSATLTAVWTAGIALVLLGTVQAQTNSVVIRTDPGPTDRLIVTSPGAGQHSSLIVTNSILRVSSTAPGTNVAAGDLYMSGGTLRLYDGSTTQTLGTQGWVSANYLAKNATDASSAASTGSWLYSLTNTSTSTAGRGVLYLQAAPSAAVATGTFYGLQAISQVADGVAGSGGVVNYGVSAKAGATISITDGTPSTNYAIHGEAGGTSSTTSITNYGVFGLANGTGTGASNYGVVGQATGNGSFGVYGSTNGQTNAANSAGVYGTNTGTTGTKIGVAGVVTTAGVENRAIYGRASGATTNWAGYFDGPVYFASTPASSSTDESTPQTGTISSVGETGSNFYGQSFIANVGVITRFGVWLQEGSAAGQVRLAIVPSDGTGNPDETNVLYQSGLVDPSTVGAWFYASGVSVNVTPGVTYWVLIDGYANGGTGWSYAGTSTTYTDTGTNFKYSNDAGVNWSTWSGPLAVLVEGETAGATTALNLSGSISGSLYTNDWTAVSFGNGWTNYGSGYQAVQYKKVGDLVFLRGLANSGANAWGTYPTIFTLPAGFRPGGRLIFAPMANANSTVRVDITTSGQVQWVSGGAGSGWISLDGIVFSVD